MKTTIQVKSKDEGAAIVKGLSDPVIKATAVVCGVLDELTEAQRMRVIRNVNESFADSEGGAS